MSKLINISDVSKILNLIDQIERGKNLTFEESKSIFIEIFI